MILCPLLVIYYAYDAYTRADWIGPTGIFVMFLVSIIINRLLMPAVVKATVEHEKYEGYFRYAHANIRTNSESLAFCGTEAAIFEKDQQVHTFDLSQHSFLLSKEVLRCEKLAPSILFFPHACIRLAQSMFFSLSFKMTKIHIFSLKKMPEHTAHFRGRSQTTLTRF